MTLKLYNTLTRRKEDFVPLDPKNVRLYVCGPTVYDFAHIGNARPIIVFDVLYRLLRYLAQKGTWNGGRGETKVTYVRNITDVDDKINARAREEGVSIRELTERTAQQFHKDIAALGVLQPTHEPRATEHIAEMIALIERLIAQGHAYEAQGHVLFDVPSMKDYGRLSRRSLDELIAGARVDVAPYKRGDMDFVLWKPSDSETPGWDSPWGRGRPGWHIECSAMAWRHLGERFDIHGGGIDLIFPHHENEIAQTRCAFGSNVMANIWMHNGFLQVEGRKMSKSEGNFVTIRDVLREWKGKRWFGDEIRLAMLMTHYSQPMDWTVSNLSIASNTLAHWFEASAVDAGGELPSGFVEALIDNLNTPLAIAELHRLSRSANSGDVMSRYQLAASLSFLGFRGMHQWEAPEEHTEDIRQHDARLQQEIESMVRNRVAARKAKNWAESDRIRDELSNMGIAIKDNKDGSTTWEIRR